MLKKLLACLLALLLVLGITACNKQPTNDPTNDPSADVTDDEDDEESEDSTNPENSWVDGTIGDSTLTWAILGNGTLVIAGEGDMPAFESVQFMNNDQPWCEYIESITKIEVKSGVTSLSPYAFKGCKYAKSAVLPTTLTKIPVNCFEGCTALTTVSGTQNLTLIEEAAFALCPALSTIDVSTALQRVCYAAFGAGSCTAGLTLFVVGEEADWLATAQERRIDGGNDAFVNAAIRYFPVA